MRAAATLTAVALTLAATVAGVPMITAGTAAHADEDTISQNVSRDGWDSREPGLSPAAVKAKSFGQIFDTKVNGQVFAQPLTVGNSVLVATEDDYVYSINRSTGAVIWSRQLGSPYAAATENCEQTPVVLPYIGVTSAPVYDPSTGTLYVSGMLSGPPGDDSNLSTATPTYDLFAINEKTGAVKWKKQIEGSPTDDSRIKFDAAIELQRTGVLLHNGSVYLGFGALCADGQANHQYRGFVAGVNTKTRSETLWTDEAYDRSDPGTGGGIWQGGGGLVSIGGSIYFATGNGPGPALGTAGSAASKQAHLGQSLIKLTVEKNGSLKPADFFSPGNADHMNLSDHDFGSGGPILLPFGTKKYRALFVTADKEANIYLLNPSNLGGRSKSATGSTAVFSGSPSLVDDTVTDGVGSTDHGLWGHMAAFAGRSATGKPLDYIYYAGVGWGAIDKMYVLKFNDGNPAKPTLQHVGTTPQTFGFSSGSPAITSNGASASSAIVWEVQVTDQLGSNGTLMAYSAVPTSGVLHEIWSAPIGNGSQFTVPATSGGRVYVGARNDGSAITAGDDQNVCPTNFQSKTYTGTDSSCVGEVYAFGTLGAQLAGSAFNVGRVALGHSVTKDVTLTNTGDTAVRITKVRAPLVPFSGPVKAPVGQRVGPGARVRIPVTFTPQARSTATGKLAVTTSDGFGTHTTTITISGTGTPAAKGVTAVPSPGGGWTLNGTATMTGTTLRLTPAARYASGSAVYYQPLVSNGLRAKFTVRLSGRAAADGLTFALLNPARSSVSSLGKDGSSLGFGSLSGVAVVLGTRKDAGDPSGNFIGIATGTTKGHLKFAATATKVPDLRYGAHVIGVTVSGRTISVTVSGKRYLSASVKLPASVRAAFTAGCGRQDGVQAVTAASVSSGAVTLPPPGGGWTFNGTAAMAGAAAALTQALPSEAGATVYRRAVSTGSFSATFNVTLSGGTGGEGLTLALLNRGARLTAVGRNGQGLGFAGLTGLAVVLGTQQVPGAPSADFVGIETSTAGGDPSLVATTDLTGVTDLLAGTHTVTVSLKAGTLTVTVDGSRVLTQKVTVASSAYVAFTGSTGSMTNRQLVQDTAISAG